jgi:hypothetical protein
MENFPALFQQLVSSCAAAIGSTPTAASFVTLVLGWILCNSKRTLSGVIRALGPHAEKSHDAYQNFFSKSQRSMDTLWKMLFLFLVKVFIRTGRSKKLQQGSTARIWIAGDDTLAKHYGRKIWGAGLYRDAVRSSKKHIAYAWGLNWVVLAMIVAVPLLKGHFVAFPILARLNPKDDKQKGPTEQKDDKDSKTEAQGSKSRQSTSKKKEAKGGAKRNGRGNSKRTDKGRKKSKAKTRRSKKTRKRKRKSEAKGKGAKKKKTTVSIMVEMIQIVAGWLPEAHFLFCGDGAYASVAGHLPENVELVSRIRRDAAVYTLPPGKRKGKRGRPPKKGRRLKSPQDKAKVVGKGWETHEVDMYGEIVERQIYTYNALWYEVCPDRLVKIVIVRDPEGEVDDEFFFSTDLDMSGVDIVHCYTGRWAIEVVFRETKQYLGMNHAQARKKKAVLRITPFCLWLNSLIKAWFVVESRKAQPTLPGIDPWDAHKDTISFQDMLGALRIHFWRNYIFAGSTLHKDFKKIRSFLVESLAKVA